MNGILFFIETEHCYPNYFVMNKLKSLMCTSPNKRSGWIKYPKFVIVTAYLLGTAEKGFVLFITFGQ